MKVRYFCPSFLLFCLSLCLNGLAQFDDFFFQRHLPWSTYSQIMPKPSLDLYLEDYYDIGIANLNGLGAFTAPDGESYSINGNPSRWIKYIDHGFDISDHFFVGTSLHKLELNFEDVYIHPHHSLLHISNTFWEKNYLGFDGGRGDFFHNDLAVSLKIQEFFLGRKGTHAVERPGSDREDLIANRRHTRQHLEFTQNYSFERPGGRLIIKNFNQHGTRSWLHFDHNGIAGTYNEDYLRINLQLIWLPQPKNIFDGWHLRYSHLYRTHLFAENYYAPDETAELEMDNVSFWGNLNHPSGYRGVHGLNISRKLIEKNEEHFAKNVIDQDGAGFEPWYPSLEIVEISQNNKGDHRLQFPFFDQSLVGWNLNQAFLHFRPLVESNHSLVYYQNADTNTALYVRKTQSEPFLNYLGFLDVGMTLKKEFFPQFLHLTLGLKGVLDVMTVSSKHLVLPYIEFNIDLDIVKNKSFYTGLFLGQKTIPLSSELALFISEDYDSGSFTYWNDNGDLVLEAEEDSQRVYRPTGGKYLELEADLRHPNYLYLDIPLQVKIGKHFGLSLTLSYKSYRNLFDVKWKESDSAYGRYDAVTTNSPGTKDTEETDRGAEDIYVITNGGDIRYVVSHDDDYPNLGDSFLTEHPFYAGAYLEGVAKGERWYVSLSFNAYMVMGRSGFGNSYLENTLGSLSEEKANPNATIRTIGRLNNDNGYTGKLIVNGEVWEGLWLGMVAKYRDGEAFSHYLTYLSDDQVSRWKREVNGDNALFPGGEFGSREDALWNLDLNLIYNFSIKDVSLRVYFQAMNVLDIGAELTEKIFEANRAALELQNPRGFRSGVWVRF